MRGLSDVPEAKNNVGIERCPQRFLLSSFPSVDSENVKWSLMSQPNPKNEGDEQIE
jgi:hypothetical protein